VPPRAVSANFTELAYFSHAHARSSLRYCVQARICFPFDIRYPGRIHSERFTIAHGVIPIVEITMTVPKAIEVIADMARRCLDAGAAFLTSPGLDLKIVEFAGYAL
jgi:hypothetical protein